MRAQCSATARSSGLPCKYPAATGQRVCRFHGGASPQAIVAAAERVLDNEIRETLARLDVEACEDPLGELSRLAGQVLAWRDAVAQRVNALTSIRYEGLGGGEQLRAEVALFERALDRCAHVLGLIAKLNLDERLVRLDERRAEIVVRAFDAGLQRAGIRGEQAQVAREHVARQLRAVPAGLSDPGA